MLCLALAGGVAATAVYVTSSADAADGYDSIDALADAARIPNDQGPDKGIWKYPRLTAIADRDLQLWHWGTQLGIPALFAYLGVVVLMVRRLR